MISSGGSLCKRGGCVLFVAVVAAVTLSVAAESSEDDLPADATEVDAASFGAPDDAIPDKVGAEVHLSKQERSALKKLECSMCKAVLSEMHTEVAKHQMTTKGWGAESQVWETANAMCLAIVQKYRLDLQKPALEKKSEEDDDEMAMASSGDPQAFMRAMLVLKMGCQRWIEDYGGDTSGYIYKVVKEQSQSPDGAAKEYCSRRVSPPLCGSKKHEKTEKVKAKEKERSQKRRELLKKQDAEEKKQKKDNPFESLPEDSKFGLQRLLEMAKDDPLHYLEDDARQRVQRAQKELRCDVCRVVLEEAHTEIQRRPKSMRDEEGILSIIDGLCEGGKDLSIPNYFGVEPPPLPPVWTDRYRPGLDKKTKKYKLKSFPKKGAKARKSWRAKASTGQQKPPGQEESEGDMMMTLACKDVLDPARMAESLFDEMAKCKGADHDATCSAGAPLRAAAFVCYPSNEGSDPCDFSDAAKGGTPGAGGKSSEL